MVQRKSVHKCSNLMHMFYFYGNLVTNYCIKVVFYEPVESMSFVNFLSTVLADVRKQPHGNVLGLLGRKGEGASPCLKKTKKTKKTLQFHVSFSCTDLLFWFL